MSANIDAMVRPRPHTAYFGGSASDRLTLNATDTPGPGSYNNSAILDRDSWHPAPAGERAAKQPTFGRGPRFKDMDAGQIGPGDYDPLSSLKALDAKKGYTPPEQMLHAVTNAGL